MSNATWRIVSALLLTVIAAYAVWQGDYGLISVLVGITAGSLVALRLGRMEISVGFFWMLTVAVAVVCFGIAFLPFVSRIVGSGLIAGGLFAALMMPFYRYGGGGARVD